MLRMMSFFIGFKDDNNEEGEMSCHPNTVKERLMVGTSENQSKGRRTQCLDMTVTCSSTSNWESSRVQTL